jgi:hypothetical protein
MNSKNSTKTKCRKCKGTGYIVKRKSGYGKGRRMEYKIRDQLTNKGWDVKRAYASKGLFDLIAIKNGQTVGIQVKDIKLGGYLKPEEKTKLESYFGNTSDYEMNVWDGFKNSVRTINVGPVHFIFHVFREKGRLRTIWRRFDGKEWIEAGLV